MESEYQRYGVTHWMQYVWYYIHIEHMKYALLKGMQ